MCYNISSIFSHVKQTDFQPHRRGFFIYPETANILPHDHNTLLCHIMCLGTKRPKFQTSLTSSHKSIYARFSTTCHLGSIVYRFFFTTANCTIVQLTLFSGVAQKLPIVSRKCTTLRHCFYIIWYCKGPPHRDTVDPIDFYTFCSQPIPLLGSMCGLA